MSFTKTELAHLKYTLINYKGYSAKQADKEINGMKEVVRINHLKAVQEKKQGQSTKPFKDSFRELIGRKNES